MGMAVRPSPDDRVFRVQQTGDAVDLLDLQLFVSGQPGEDGGDAAGDHGLARSGRPGEQQIMKAGGRDQGGPSGEGLAAYIPEIRRRPFLIAAVLFFGERRRRSVPEVFDGLVDGLYPYYRDAVYGKSLACIAGRNDQCAQAFLPCTDRDGKDAADRIDASVQTELSDGHQTVQRGGGDLSGRSDDGQGDGEIIERAAFRHIGRGEVDRDPARGKRDPAVAEGRTDPVLRFPDLRAQIADHDEAGKTVADVGLYGDRKDIKAEDGGGADAVVHFRHLAGRRAAAPRMCMEYSLPLHSCL